jgi:hypothetical protein
VEVEKVVPANVVFIMLWLPQSLKTAFASTSTKATLLLLLSLAVDIGIP